MQTFSKTAFTFCIGLTLLAGQALAGPGEVPWENLEPSTLVRIHYRTAPYRAKWVINTVASADAPVPCGAEAV